MDDDEDDDKAEETAGMENDMIGLAQTLVEEHGYSKDDVLGILNDALEDE